MFTANDYRKLSNIVFQDDYPGYRKNIIESPNGDHNWDTDKRYAHVATKYLNTEQYKSNKHRPYLMQLLNTANKKAIEVAIEIGVPKRFWPNVNYGALRVLEYPSGSVTHPHVDFDLFTLMCYRNLQDNFKYIDKITEDQKDIKQFLVLENARELNHQIHFGEILELINPKAFRATKHEVIAERFDRTQYSIVYFSIPNHNELLPKKLDEEKQISVGEWIEERISRSRKEVY